MFEELLYKIISEKDFKQFEMILEKELIDFDDFESRVKKTIFVSIGIWAIIFYFYNINVYVFLGVTLLIIPLSLIFNYIYLLYKEEMRQKKIDEALPDFLLQASLMPKGTSIIEIFEKTSKQKLGPLTLEIKLALNQIKNGFSVDTAIESMINRNHSKLLKRVLNLLLIGYRSGKDMSFIFSKLSQDLLNIQDIERDRYSGLAMQKYTLLASSALLVPLILSWVFGIVQGMDLSLFTGAEGLGKVNPETIKFAGYAIYVYLAEFSILSSVFASIIDGDWKKFIIYVAVLLPLAYAVFFLA